MPGVLVLAATPIGDPSDASARLAQELATADVIAAEDTRRLRRLCAALGVTLTGRVVSYHDHNEGDRTAELVDVMQGGGRVLVCTDAGMPSVSDPGYRLVRAAVGAGIRVTTLPGPSAVLAALALSALPVDRFCFEGFLPRKAGERASRLAELASEPRTMVFFEAPHRLPAALAAMVVAFGPGRLGSACREMTKTYEEVRRGRLDELVTWAAQGVRGEVTVVVAGAGSVAGSADDSGGPPDGSELASRVAGLAPTVGRKAAIGQVAREAGLPKRVVYDAVVAARASSS